MLKFSNVRPGMLLRYPVSGNIYIVMRESTYGRAMFHDLMIVVREDHSGYGIGQVSQVDVATHFSEKDVIA